MEQWFNGKMEGGLIKMCQRKTKQMREFEPILKVQQSINRIMKDIRLLKGLLTK